MQIGTNTLLLALAAILALGVAYLMVAAPTWGGGLNAASAGCGMMGGSGSGAACSVGNVASAGSGGTANPASAPAAGGSTGSGNDGAGSGAPSVQEVYVKALGGSNFGQYDVNELRVKAGTPVRLHFTAEQGAGCGSVFVIYGMNVRMTSRNGQEAIAEFTPQKAGTYTYSCGMMMFGPGKFIVE